MNNFKSKLAFFQNAALQQQAHQQQSYQQPIRQQQYPAARQSQNQSFGPKANPSSTISNSTETQSFSSTIKPSIVVPKPIVSNSNFKSKLAFFNQQPAPLVPIHTHQNDTALHQENAEHKVPKTSYPTSNSRVPIAQPSSNKNDGNHEISHICNSSIQVSVNNNENIPQPINDEFKVQQPRQPPKSFKEKLALLSSIQQPMGVYDYKKKQNFQTSPEAPIQKFPDTSIKTPQNACVQPPPEPHLPSLTAGRARRQTRRPPSLDQSTNNQGLLPSTS